MHLRSHYGIVGPGVLLLYLLALVSVKKRVFLLACRCDEVYRLVVFGYS